MNQSPYSRLTTGLYSVLLLAAMAGAAYALGANIGIAQAADEGSSSGSSYSVTSEDPSDSKGESLVSSEEVQPIAEEIKPQKPVVALPAMIAVPARDDLEEAGFEDYRATAYCLRGATATGLAPKVGMIAADPRVLPFGTLVHIRAGSYTGVYKVVDTGGRIKGRIVDIYVSNHSEAVKFGRRPIRLKVIGRATSHKTVPAR